MASNIFSQSIAYVHSQSFPILPPWLYPWLIVLGAWRMIMVFSCTAIFLIPIFKGPASRRKNLWLIRRKYSTSNIPYLVPNRPMMVVLCELLSGLMYSALACVNYASFKSPQVYQNAQVVIWYGTSLLPSYLGIWLGGWGLVYSCIDPGVTSSVVLNRFLKPKIYNSVYILWSILVAMVTAFWATMVGLKSKRLFHKLNELLQLLTDDEEKFNSNPTNLGGISLLALQNVREDVQTAFSQFSARIQNWSICWIIFELILVTFYVFILFHLHQKINILLQLCRVQGKLLMNHSKSHTISSSTLEKHHGVDESSMALAALRKELRFIALSNLSISIVLLLEIAVLSFQVVCSRHLTEPDWLALTSILCMVPSTFISPVLLLQCWRIFSERSVAEYSDSAEKARLASQRRQLPIFQHQLLDWYAGSRLDESDVFDTFSGLIERPDSPTITQHLHLKQFSSRLSSETSNPTVQVAKCVTVQIA